VSPATVSYVVNNGPRPVSRETRKKVLWAIDQLDYHPSAIARSLKTNTTQTIGIVISDVLNPILASVAKNAEDLLLEEEYAITLCNSDDSPSRESIWLRTLIRRRTDGVILLSCGSNRALLSSMVDSGQSLVLIDRKIEGVDADCVLFDNESAVYDAVCHLIALGHSRIGLLNVPSAFTPGRGRLRGYKRALHDAGLFADPQLIKEGGFKAHESQSLVAELLDLRPQPSALFVSNHLLAKGVLWQVKARGLRMPADLAVCVFDDVDCYEFSTPSITAISCDIREFAQKTVHFLLDRIKGSYAGEPRSALIPYRLQVRESTVGPTDGS
jgi:LacI family transcriptional regulator